MRRVAVIGNAAGGKSTLARALASVQGLPHHEVDAILWKPDWTAVPEADYDAGGLARPPRGSHFPLPRGVRHA